MSYPQKDLNSLIAANIVAEMLYDILDKKHQELRKQAELGISAGQIGCDLLDAINIEWQDAIEAKAQEISGSRNADSDQ